MVAWKSYDGRNCDKVRIVCHGQQTPATYKESLIIDADLFFTKCPEFRDFCHVTLNAPWLYALHLNESPKNLDWLITWIYSDRLPEGLLFDPKSNLGQIAENILTALNFADSFKLTDFKHVLAAEFDHIVNSTDFYSLSRFRRVFEFVFSYPGTSDPSIRQSILEKATKEILKTGTLYRDFYEDLIMKYPAFAVELVRHLTSNRYEKDSFKKRFPLDDSAGREGRNPAPFKSTTSFGEWDTTLENTKEDLSCGSPGGSGEEPSAVKFTQKESPEYRIPAVRDINSCGSANDDAKGTTEKLNTKVKANDCSETLLPVQLYLSLEKFACFNIYKCMSCGASLFELINGSGESDWNVFSHASHCFYSAGSSYVLIEPGGIRNFAAKDIEELIEKKSTGKGVNETGFPNSAKDLKHETGSVLQYPPGVSIAAASCSEPEFCLPSRETALSAFHPHPIDSLRALHYPSPRLSVKRGFPTQRALKEDMSKPRSTYSLFDIGPSVCREPDLDRNIQSSMRYPSYPSVTPCRGSYTPLSSILLDLHSPPHCDKYYSSLTNPRYDLRTNRYTTLDHDYAHQSQVHPRSLAALSPHAPRFDNLRHGPSHDVSSLGTRPYGYQGPTKPAYQSLHNHRVHENLKDSRPRCGFWSCNGCHLCDQIFEYDDEPERSFIKRDEHYREVEGIAKVGNGW